MPVPRRKGYKAGKKGWPKSINYPFSRMRSLLRQGSRYSSMKAYRSEMRKSRKSGR